MMSEQQFDARIAAIDQEHARRREGADAYRDQEMARLFEQCAWTQERIAERMGKKQPWVCKRLTFGRFLSFIPVGISIDALTENRFREHWQRTKGKEEERFAQVAWRLEHSIPHGKAAQIEKPGVRLAVVECLADGKWYTIPQLAATAEESLPGLTEDQVQAALRMLRLRPPEGKEVKVKKIGKRSQYRLTKAAEKTRSPGVLDEIYDRVSLLIDELEECGRMHRYEMTPQAVLQIAVKLRRIFEEVTRNAEPRRVAESASH